MGDNSYRHIGRHVSRADRRELISGRRQPIDDVRIPGMLTARILRNPYSHANIVDIHVEKAKAPAGVRAVLTYKDAPDRKRGLSQHRKVLDHKVRFTGDSVALVAAETLKTADEACRLIEVEYEELPLILGCEEAIKPEASQLYEESPGDIPPRVTPFSGKPFNQIHAGDVERASGEAAYVAEGYYCYDRLPHPLPPESPDVIAQWTSPSAVTLYYNGGASHLQKLNTEVPIPGIAVRAIACHSGGPYGSKQLIPHLALQAIALAREMGRAVKPMVDRMGYVLSYELRQGNRTRNKVGIIEDGIISAIQGMWYVDSDMFSTYAQVVTAVGLGGVQVFCGKCRNWDLDTMLIATNHNSQTLIRGFGGQELKGALVPPVYTVIRTAYMGPYEAFKKDFVKAGDSHIWRDYRWWEVYSADFTAVFEGLVARSRWKDKWKGWGAPTWVSEDGKCTISIDVGVHGNMGIREDPAEGFVKFRPFRSVAAEMCIGETGGVQRHAIQKMAAEVMKVPFDGIQLVNSDTHGAGHDAGMIDSRGAITMRTCAVRATNDARRKLLEMVAEKLHTGVDDLDTRDFLVFPKASSQIRPPWTTIIETPEMTITGMGLYQQNFDKPNFALYFAEVEVNLGTRETKLLRALEGADVGQVVDPVNVRMQAEGSFGAASADVALFGGMVIDKELGRLVSGNIIDYKWRTFNEFPPFDTVILKEQSDTESSHTLGFGEISGSPVPSAVLMAVSNIIGTEVKEYPTTSIVVLKTMGKIK